MPEELDHLNKDKPPVKAAGHLVVFADDWGRHPSSCQHLMTHLLDRYEVTWVNTIGTRRPSLSISDLGKISTKLRAWRQGSADVSTQGEHEPHVLNPVMYPGFRKQWQRQFNAARVAHAVNKEIQSMREHLDKNSPRVAITTLPLTADLVDKIEVDRWVYYAVDDFSVWPGLDHDVMERMERELVERVDVIISVSENIQQRIDSMGCDSVLLEHGVDLEHWKQAEHQGHVALPDDVFDESTRRKMLALESAEIPIMLFWGLVDQRLDMRWLKILSEVGAVVMIGPVSEPDPVLYEMDGVILAGAVDYDRLPRLAQWADVLIMPYADLPVTRAMQPLKFKEYLASGKPVIARALPAIQSWAEAADLLVDQDMAVKPLARLINDRKEAGLSASQIKARAMLSEEGWAHKALLFESCFQG